MYRKEAQAKNGGMGRLEELSKKISTQMVPFSKNHEEHNRILSCSRNTIPKGTGLATRRSIRRPRDGGTRKMADDTKQTEGDR